MLCSETQESLSHSQESESPSILDCTEVRTKIKKIKAPQKVFQFQSTKQESVPTYRQLVLQEKALRRQREEESLTSREKYQPPRKRPRVETPAKVTELRSDVSDAAD